MSHLIQHYSPEVFFSQEFLKRIMIPSSYQRIKDQCFEVSQITITDLKPECKKTCLESFLIIKIDLLFTALKDLFNFWNQDLGTIRGKELTEKMLPLLQNQIESLAKESVKKIEDGRAPFSELFNFDITRICFQEIVSNVIKKLPQQTNPAKNKKMEQVTLEACMFEFEPNLTPFEEKKMNMKGTAFLKQCAKNDRAAEKESNQKMEDYFNHQRYFLFVSAKIDKKLDDLTIEDCDSLENKKAYRDFFEQRREELERQKALEIEKSFQPAPQVKKEPAKNKGKKQHKHKPIAKKLEMEKEKTPKPLPVVVHTLPSFFPLEPFYDLDPRIIRWFHKDPRTFLDRVNGKMEHRYISLSKEDLEQQVICHRLPGVHRLMSISPKDLARYSRPYQFEDHGKLREGRCFLAELQQGKLRQEGMIYVGVDGRRIYHANFVPFSTMHRPSTPKELCIPLDGFHSDLESQEKWEVHGLYSLERENDLIVWSIEGRTQFKISPLF